MNRNVKLGYAVCSVAAVLLLGCGKELAKTHDGGDVDIMKYAERPPGLDEPQGWYVTPPADIIHIPHDAFVRWEGSHSDSYGPEVQWFWNRQSVGAGSKGWKNICKKLLVMPRGAKVLFFPRLEVALGVSSSRPFGVRRWFWDRSFRRIVSMRELVIIFSVRNEEDKVCPLLEPQYERWLKKQGKE